MPYGDGLLTINVYLAPVPGTGTNLTDVLLLVPLATNSLDGDRYREYTSTTDVDDDFDAGFISATTQGQANDMFAQTTLRPQKVLIGYVDLVAVETYLVAMDACITAGADFYYVATPQATLIAQQEALSAGVEADGFRLYAFQTITAARTDWYGAVWPATWVNFEGRERSFCLWHELDTENLAGCYAAARGAYDPTQQSAGWLGNVKEIPASAALTSAQETNLLANFVNLGKNCTLGTNWVAEGNNCNGRAIDHIVSIDWFRATIQTKIYERVAKLAAFGRKLTADDDGANQIAQIVANVANDGVALGHFDDYTDPDTGIQYPKVTASANRTARSITVNAEVYFENQVTSITINAYGNE